MAKTKIGGITVEIGADTSGLSKKLNDVNKESRKTVSELKSVDAALKQAPNSVELWKQKQELLTKSIENSKKKLEALVSEQANMQKGFEDGKISEDAFKAYQREVEVAKGQIEAAEKALREFEQDLKNAQTAANELKRDGKTAAKEVGEAFENAGTKISKAGEKIGDAGKKLSPITAAVTAVGGYGIKSAAQFEDAMAKVSTIADETQIPIETLGKSIKKLSDDTGVDAAELADNVYNAISAGQDTAAAVNFVEKSSKLATAGFADSAAALDILTTVMNAYGLSAEEVGHVSDVLISTQNLGKTTVGDLASSMGKVIPTAKASGVSLENLAASYAIMTSNGIATAESTTYLNSLLNELSKSGTKSSEVLKKVTGKSFQELTTEGKSLADILAVIQQNADANGVSMNDLFGSAEAGKAALTLLSGGVGDYNDKLQSMADANGATDKAFAKLQTNSRKAQIAINQIKNSVIELGVTILQMLQPHIERTTKRIRELTARFNSLDDSTKKTIIKIAGVAAAIAPVLLVIGKLTTGIGAVTSAAGKLFSVIAANPVVAVIAAITAALVLLYTKSESFREFINGFVADIAAFAEVVAADLEDMWKDVQPILEDIWSMIQSVLDILEGPTKVALSGVMELFKIAWNTIKAVWDVVVPYFRTIVNGISAVFSVVKAVLTGDFQGAWDGIKAVFSASKQFFVQVWKNITDAFSSVGKFFKDVFGYAWRDIKEVFSGVGDFFGGIWDTIVKKFSTIGTKVAEAIGGTFKSAINSVIGTIEGALNLIPRAVNGAIKAINKLPGVSISRLDEIELPRLAKGGTLSEGSAIVAEAGPELIQMLNGKARVTPLTNSSRNTAVQATEISPQRTVVHQTYNIYVKEFASPQDARTTSQELARLERQTNFGKGLATT